MGSADRCSRTTLFARCCYGASFGFGFVLTILTLAVMFWIAWCYFGLTIVQISDTQRRAIVNYSYTTSKPFSSTTTASPSRSTTLATEETSINSISKLPTTESLLRGSSRGESQVKINKRKETAALRPSLAKGDFAARDRATNSDNHNATVFPSKDATASVILSPRGPQRNKEEQPLSSSKEKASILTASSVDNSEEDRVYARRVLPPGSENRPEEKHASGDRNVRRNPSDLEPISRLDIAPTKVYDTDTKSESPRLEDSPDRPPRDETRTPTRDFVDRDKSELPRRDDIQSSRRAEPPESPYREPDFDREYPRRSAGTDRERSRYDDIDDERGSRGRYDRRDRGRESDDRYPKGDTRVYPDDRGLSPDDDDRYQSKDRYADDISPKRRGDDDRHDDRYKDYNERSRSHDRDFDDRPPLRDDRYRDDERHRTDDHYRPRDDDRYRGRDDDRYRPREDDRYRPRDDDTYRSRDDDRYTSRDDDRIRSRDDDRYVYREDERYRSRVGDDTYKARDDDRYRSDPADRRGDEPVRPRDDYRPRDVDDTPTSRLRDTDFREPVSRGSGSSLPVDRKPTSSRPEYDARVEGTVTDYDNPERDRPRSYVRDGVNPSRLSRPIYDDVRDRDRDDEDRGYRRPSRYEDDVRDISPTKTRDDASYSRSSLIDSRPREVSGSRYTNTERDRTRDDRYYEQDERIRNTRIQESKSSLSGSENSRRISDDDDRYRTRLANERTEDPKIAGRREEVVLDRRSYASEEDEEYRRRDSKTDSAYEDRDRRPIDESRRRYRDEESYSRRRDPIDDEDYKRSRTRDNYERDRGRSRDRYDEEYRRYDDDRYPTKGDRSPPLPPARKYDSYPDIDERPRLSRDPEISGMRKENSRDREEILRPSSSSRAEEKLYGRDEYSDSKSSSRRRYTDDDLSLADSRDLRDDYPDDRRYSRGSSRQPASDKEFTIGSSRPSVNAREPTEVVIREKRFQSSSGVRQKSSRVYGDEAGSYTDAESKSKEHVHPLSAKDVIEAAIRYSGGSDQNSRKVYYPVFDPRVSNLTSPEIIRPSERRGTTITAKKRRSI